MQSNEFIYKVRSGASIVWESIIVLFHNPILLVYGIPLLSIQVIQKIFKPTMLTISIETAVTLLFILCLANHTMHILRQQAASLTKTLREIVERWQQIALWFVLWSVLTLGVERSINRLTKITSWANILHLIAFWFTLVAVIVATEHGSVWRSLKRSLHLIWHHLTTFISILFCMLVSGIVMSIISWVTPIMDYIIYFFILPVSTIAFTIFYYEFYVKRELELAEIFATRM